MDSHGSSASRLPHSTCSIIDMLRPSYPTFHEIQPHSPQFQYNFPHVLLLRSPETLLIPDESTRSNLSSPSVQNIHADPSSVTG